MSWLKTYLRSSVGAKHVMAVTGLLLSLFVLAHMFGNLGIFLGPDYLNTYAQGIQEMPALVWTIRVGLLTIVLVHIVSALRLSALNRAARPVKYHVYKPVRAPFYARTMTMTGIILFAFIVYHVLHFTAGTILPDAYHTYETLPDGIERHDVYAMVVLGFQNVAISLSYIIAMVFLSMHLAHGMSSWLQSLGLTHPKYRGFISKLGPVYGLVILIGNSSIPLAVLTGLIE